VTYRLTMKVIERNRHIETAEDDEQFCDLCFAGLLSAEHFQKCELPERKREEAS